MTRDALLLEAAIAAGVVFSVEYIVTGDAAHDVRICEGCGCSEFNPCPGGCHWVTEDRCSRCVG